MLCVRRSMVCCTGRHGWLFYPHSECLAGARELGNILDASVRFSPGCESCACFSERLVQLCQVLISAPPIIALCFCLEFGSAADMDGVVVFSGASILSTALNEMGGTEPLFVNVLGNNSFRMRVSFAIPSTDDAAVMQDIAVLGDVSDIRRDAEESACFAALQILWESHGRVVLDYSILRVWCCEERHAGLLEKLQQGKSSLEGILEQSHEVINSLLPASVLFAQKINDMRAEGANDAVISSATSCVAFLQMMHLRGTIVHGHGMNQYRGMDNHGSLNNLLRAEGFILPSNNDGLNHETGGIRMMLDRVADLLDYKSPASRTQTRDVRHKCFIDFSPIVPVGRREFTAVGCVSGTIERAVETAIYNALLALCVNNNVQIEDVYRQAYVFARDRVTDIGSDLEALGNSGNTICSYVNTTCRGLRRMVDSYSQLLRRYSSGSVLADKLQSLASDLQHCLDSISSPVCCMNENAIVGSLPF